MSIEDLTKSMQLVERYANYKIHKIWSIALIAVSILNTLIFLAFDLWIGVARNSELIYGLNLALVILVMIILVFQSFRSVRKMVIEESKIVSKIYVRLAIALFVLFFYFSILLLIGEIQELYMSPPMGTNVRFPMILGGLTAYINGHYTEVYWGYSLALIIPYFLLRKKSRGLRRIELLVGFVVLTIYNGLTLYIDPFVYKLNILGDLTYLLSNVITLICGIISLIVVTIYFRRYKTTVENTNSDRDE